jgi:archaeosortase C (PEF-CTERM variant)
MGGVADTYLPIGSPRRKIAQLISAILLVEGISSLLLFSSVSPVLGLVTILLGMMLMGLLFVNEEGRRPVRHESIGVRVVSGFEQAVGGKYGLSILGALLILMVVSYNVFASVAPSYGDVDVILMMFGGSLLVFPLVPHDWRIEAIFALFFLGFVALLLAVPQAVMSIGGGGEASSVGNWYVHYMLAAPFASILNLLGITASSAGNIVTLQFHDGSIQTLQISAYCAGLYSFSIFLSAFLSFVLVLENLRPRVLVVVMGFGILVAYLGNLLRMVVVGVVGYYRGIEALHWAHENAGWVIFLAWSSVFWWIIIRYTSRTGRETAGEAVPDSPP